MKFGREIFVERDDFMENPPKKFFRLSPGTEVRLRYAYFITCREVLVTKKGEIYVACGHGQGKSEILKFSKDGKLIKRWGQTGKGPGEFDQPHALAMDSKGRLFIGDRNNNRIQIFDEDGKFLAEWPQFSRPSGIYIDKRDVIYVADSSRIGLAQSRRVEARHPHRQREGRLGELTSSPTRPRRPPTPAPPKAWPPTRRATSTAPKSAPAG